MKSLITLLSVLFILLPHHAYAEQFQAPYTDTQWTVESSPLMCSLSQNINGFGHARFQQKPGETFTLSFITNTFPAMKSNAYFEIAEASWQNIAERTSISTVMTEYKQTQFNLTGDLAHRAFTHVKEGRFLTFRYHSVNLAELIDVLISTVHLSDVLPQFEQCLAQLHPDTFNTIRQLTVHFKIEKSELPEKAKQALSRLASYIKIDPSIKRITITGYTDNHGRKKLNQPLSEARAIAVKNYLIEQESIPEQLLIISAAREKEPIATNKTQAGRALNRRAEIIVSR